MIGNNPALLAGDPEGVFEHQLEALEGQPPTQLGSVMQGLIGAANEDHNLARVFSTFTATNPSIFRGGRTRTCKCLLYELEPLNRPKRDNRYPETALPGATVFWEAPARCMAEPVTKLSREMPVFT